MSLRDVVMAEETVAHVVEHRGVQLPYNSIVGYADLNSMFTNILLPMAEAIDTLTAKVETLEREKSK